MCLNKGVVVWGRKTITSNKSVLSSKRILEVLLRNVEKTVAEVHKEENRK